VYTVLTQLALLVVGIVWIFVVSPVWPGWGVLGFAVLSIALLIATGDMPPFTHYVPLVVVGVVVAAQSPL
jgi:hypothetical protein